MQRITYHLGADNETQKIDQKQVIGMVAMALDGATVSFGTGIWHGTVEESAVITYYAPNDVDPLTFAQRLRNYFKQKEVLTVVEPITML